MLVTPDPKRPGNSTRKKKRSEASNMARVGFSPEETVAGGGLFKFDAGYGEIVEATVKNVEFGGYPAHAAAVIGIQRLDKNLKPTDAEVVYEELGFGKTLDTLRAGNASDSDGEAESLPAEVDAEGNCLYAEPGGVVDKKSSIAIFGESLVKLGFPAALLNGYMPNLIGIKAQFMQKMLEKGKNFTGKNDPSCLVAVEKIHDMGPAARGGKATSKPASGTGKAPGVPAKAAGAGKANGAAPVGGDSEELEAQAVNMLALLAESSKGQTMTRQKLSSKLVTVIAKAHVPVAVSTQIQKLVKTDEFFLAKAEEFGWRVNGDSVEIPAD
jgi:hypothetical protein